jgi:hypothetical protein
MGQDSGKRSRGRPPLAPFTLTEPETAPMSKAQHQQAVAALSAMIVRWLQSPEHQQAHGRVRTNVKPYDETDRELPEGAGQDQ